MKFCRQLYNKHDPIAKQITKTFWEQFGYEVIDDGEHYGDYDYKIRHKDGIIEFVEVEQKTGWKTYTFPFQTMDVAGRKSKSKADWFIQVNNTGNSLNICPMSIIHSSKQSRKDTIYSQQELFYNVELTKIDNYVYNEIEQKWLKFGQKGLLRQDNKSASSAPQYLL